MTDDRLETSRRVVERIEIGGKLSLETPCCLGNGDKDSLADMPLALDQLQGCALLTGTSIAGALRAYLREREFGYRNDGGPDALHNRLFGRQEEEEGEQSWLIVNDSLGEMPKVELRDGVSLDPKTHTAEHKKKFDFELLEAGTTFSLRLELLVPQNGREDILRSMTIALQGLENGEIALGARKRRGLGRCRVKEWQVTRYDLTTTSGLLDWLNHTGKPVAGSSISQLLVVQPDMDFRELFILQTVFGLEGSLLIRSAAGEASSPDSVHLQSIRNKTQVPILSGTSLAGALRSRALRIAKTVGTDDKANKLIDDMFGRRIRSSTDRPEASRLITAETEITSPLKLVQNRVKIDRFTGGSYPTALFSEQPVWGQDETAVIMKIMIQQPSDAQIGLLLLLLKDLWTGDLPLGGEISVGRGRLQGKKSSLTYKRSENLQQWSIIQADGGLDIDGNRDQLEQFVSGFVKEMQE
jgi:CRISPR/Cas system CSM-associated protein Csm3 (group 7 of RAMP superfamily)